MQIAVRIKKAIFHGFLTFFCSFSFWILTSYFLLHISNAPIIIKIIPGLAFANLEVKPETSTIHVIFPENPRIVRIMPPIIQAVPEIKGSKNDKNSICTASRIILLPSTVFAKSGSIDKEQLQRHKNEKMIKNKYVVLWFIHIE